MAKDIWDKDPVVESAKSPWDQDPVVKKEYGVGTGLSDALSGPYAGAVSALGSIPIGVESMVRNVPRQVLEQQGMDRPEKVGPMTFAEELVKKGPVQLFANTARAFVKQATGESFEKQQERQKDNEIALDRVISKIPNLPGVEASSEWGQKKSEAIRETMSDVGKARIADSQATGDLLKAAKNLSLEEISLGKDPSVMGYLLQGSEVLGSMMPTIVTALLTRKAPSLQTKATATVGAGMGAGEAVQDTRQMVEKMSDLELAQSSPYFAEMLKKGVPVEEARKVVTDKAAEYAAQLQGSVSAFGSVLTGKLITGQFDKLLTGPVKNRLGRIAIGGAAGMAEEGTQEFLEGIAKNLGINKTIITEIGADSFANFILGAIGGAGPGAYRGFVAKTAEEANAPKPTKEDLDAQMRASLTGSTLPVTGVPPTVPTAAAPVPPAPPAAPAAMVEEDDLAPSSPIPASVVAPVAAMVSTVGLEPATAQQVEGLKAELKMINSRRTDPTRIPSDGELEFLDEREAELAKEITALISPKAPVAPVAPVETTAEPLNVELKARAEMRVNQLLADAQETGQVNLREMNKLARDLEIEPLADPMQTAGAIFDKINPREEPVSVAPVDKELVSNLQKFGEPITSRIDAESRFSNGEKIYAFPEQDEQPFLIRNIDELSAYPPDSLLALPSTSPVTEQVATEPKIAETPAEKPTPTQAEINRQRQADQREAAQVGQIAPPEDPEVMLKRIKGYEDAKVKYAADLDPRFVLKALGNAGADVEMVDEALPELRKLEEMGLIKIKPGRRKSFYLGKGAEEAGLSRGSSYQEVVNYLSSKEKPKTVVEMPEKEAKPAIEVSANKIFTEDAATKARNRLRSKLGQLNSGIDPEFLIDGITLSGYHIEKGARTFSAYAKAMIADLGDKVKPYLKQWYNAVRDDPSAKSLVDSMDDYDTVKNANLPDTTDGMMDLMDPEDKFDIAKLMSYTMSGPNPNEYKNILEARAFITKLTGKKIEAGTAEAKEADETIETAVVLAARDIIELNRNNGNEFRTYDDLVALYERQPNLSVRTSTSMAEQAYSTPAPLAYVASRLAGITQNTTVYEPTAGNGMLLIAANPKKVIANELNATRYEMLERVMDGATINNQNAVELDISNDFDAIIANPPFGVVKNRAGETISYDVDGLKTNEIDHAIAFKALNNMKENGRAVLIVGGVIGASEDSRRDGYRSKSKRAFYQNLYDKYNVVDHFTVAGDMYKKQGAAYPVDIIVIDGKGQSSRKLPAADLPKVIGSYEQLKEKLNEASRMESRPTTVTRPDSGESTTRTSERGLLDTGTVVPSATAGEEGRKPTGSTTERLPATEAGGRTTTEPSGADTGRKEPTATDVSTEQQLKQKPVSSTGEGVGSRGAGVTGRGEPTGLGVSSGAVNERVRPPVKEEETQYQITYSPKSRLKSVETLMPKGMADAIRRSLDKLEAKVGDIDAYVANSLQMDLATLGDYFSAEQADALALSIDNAERGKGFIIGDQTGIGKGRVVAGMIKYAIVNGKIPIFVTEKTNLYADMIRDLNEIGMSDFLDLETNKQRVLITNASSKDKVPYTFIKDEGGKKIEKDYILQSPKKGKNMGNLLDTMVKDGDIGNYKVIFTTYDQMKTVKKGATTPRREFLRHFANNNYIILDESHNAGGTGTPDPKKENVAKFARGLINSSYGSFFSSATYAKRANVMDLYASTDMSLAVDNIQDLAVAIQQGGVPMQQVVATMLAEAGQYIRREKSFEGITYETKEVPIDKNVAENMATTLRSVLSFSSAKEDIVDSMQVQEDESGGVLFGGDRIPSDVEGDNFGATMHNLIGQMLLSLKAEQAASYAIERLEKGEKVVLTVSNTMGSFLNEFAADMGLSKGDPVDLSFKDLFLKYLNKQRIVKIKNEYGEAPEFIDGVKEVYLTDEMLGPKLLKLFESIREQIENANYGASPVSPIDYMQAIIKKAGYKTAEITGRNLVIDYSTPALILDTRDSGIMQRLESIKQFNNSDLDLMTLNRAGSTGLSLHSSERFKNQNKRHMIVVQADADIAVHMQMLGRVNRTGQVNKPAYTQLGGDIPAENRPMAVLAKKMASLNANTTAGQKSAVTAENVVDFVNEYGGQIAQEFLVDNPWFNETIGNRITIKEDPTKGTDEDIRKLTGYIPVFPIKQQEEIYQDLLERYSSLIDSVNSMGVNKLEAKAMDLDSVQVSRKQITEDKEEDSPFARPAFMEKLDVKRTVKPLTSQEVNELVVKNLNGKEGYEIARELKADLRVKVADYISSKKKEMLEKEADPIRINQFEKQTELTESHVNAILDNYRIGESISIKSPEGLITYGVITDLSTKGKSVNPAAASTWKMQIALANGDSKSLSLSFSQIGNINGFTLTHENMVDYINLQTGQAQRMRISEIFDAGSGERREKRWMVTGNLLAGFADYPGQIVFYRKNDGSVDQGILMPRTFDFEKSENEAPVKIKKPEDVIRFLKEVQNSSVGTKDKVLRVTGRNGLFSFVVPRSKRVGGTFSLDEGLMKAIGTQFTSRGTDMIANTYSEENALAAFDYIINVRNDPIIAMTGAKEAKAMFPPKVALENIENFVGNVTPTQIEGRRDEIRQENIQRLKNLTREINKNVKLVETGKVNLQVQRDLVYLREAKKSMQKVISRTKPSKVGAQWVRTKASGDNAAKNLSDDAYKVVENLANKYPNLLDGLQLSIPESKRPGVTGNFDPIERLVTVYKGGSDQARTMRHEIAHSMEQMMTPDAQMAVVESWADALSKAIEKNTDKPSQDYFHAVLEFIEKPSIANQKKANDLMPDYSFYQYLNPSEYWAVNAEPLMKAQLGSGWAKFVKGMQKLWESIKSVLGFDNRYAVHKEFNRIMSGDQQRITSKMLVEYVTDNAESLKFLNNIEEFKKQFAEDGFNKTPIEPSSTVKDTLLGGAKQAKQAYDNTIDAPALAYKAMSGKLLRGITYVRNKNIWFGAGLEMAERINQRAAGLAGKLRDGEGRAMASIAITNALHAGNIAVEVIRLGSLAFDPDGQMFQAIKRPFSMANVLIEKSKLIARVGEQTAADMIQMFFEAKRSASITNEYKQIEKEIARLDAERLAPGLSDEKLNKILNDLLDAKQSLKQVGIAKKKVRFTEDQIKFYGDLENANPELRNMLDNWTKVNENMIDMMLFSKIISKKRAERLKGIKDYVPWYRIQDDMEDVHDKTAMGGVRSNTNIAKEQKFKDTEVDMDIDNIVDNMLHNVMTITRNSMRNHAANRVVDAYATRTKGKIAVFPKEGATNNGAVRLNILRNGRRIIVEIKDPLIAESVTGMEDIAIPGMDILGMAANGLRRGITLWPEFQVRQLFMDAPTAALVSGVKNPTKLWSEVFAGFAKAVKGGDPIVELLQSYGIGGYQSYTRTPQMELKQKIGLIENNKLDKLISELDRIGDASDMAQRVAIYKRVLAETGDKMQALVAANNVIDFKKRGSGRLAQFLTRTVSFMNAYAQQIDVLALTLAGSGYTGKSKAAALAQLGKTAALFSFYVMLYSWAVGGEDDYEELDDQTKLRNIYIPKSLTQYIGMDNGLLIPMHTSASFFFKSIPEMTYNTVMKEGTENEIDGTRLRHALAEAAMDSLLGPSVISTGVKPFLEIGLNRSFFTGRAITPKTLEGIDAAEQYNATTSQLGKGLSFLTGLPFQAVEAVTGFKVGDKRVINPIEADHLVRSLFGTTGAAVQWGTNIFSGDRPTPRDKDNPFYGSFIAADVGRAPEDLFYSFKDKVDGRYKTYQNLLKDAKFEQADKYFDRYEKEISAHTYISSMDSDLAKINREIRALGRTSRDMTPDERRAEITEMQRLKNQILDDVIAMRKEAGL
jgi:hypothetical protein